MTHQIRQQFLEVEFTGTEAEGLEIQRLLPELYYQKLLPAIEKAFDQSFPENQVLKIDRLEIDAGSINLDRINQEFAATVLAELLKVIQREIIHQNVTHEKSIQDNHLAGSTAENLADVLIYFLKTGSLPWSFRLKPGKTLEDALDAEFAGGWNEKEISLIVLKLKDALSYPNAIKRLVNQFSYKFQSELLQLVSIEVKGIAEKIFSYVDIENLPPEIIAEFRKVLIESSFNYSLVAERPTESVLISRMADNLPAGLSSQAEIKEIIKTGSTVTIKMPDGKQNGKAHQNPIQVSTQEGIYIDNAGLVLLHPFLPRYFETLGIVKDNEMLRPDRALSLLHFLVTEQTTAPEYELVLPKILCEYSIIAPVASEGPINENESDESLALLTAIILHWSALRNTGPEALRQTFLKRPGKLYQDKNGDWRLVVETQTFDVLLEQLPWGINMIKLPWMKQMLKVEWMV
jgi:hypothetical protein